MSAKHTPGPWHSIDRNPSSGLDIRGGSHHYPIAKVQSYWDGPGPRSEESLANCDLIAAAPDMLAALNRCRDALDAVPMGILAADSLIDAAMKVADAAIAKASGNV